jgi:hypothetical protein
MMFTIIFMFKISFLSATFDLNQHHLQYIADNLSNNECVKLLGMLEINADDANADINNELGMFFKKWTRLTVTTTATTTATTISTTVNSTKDSRTCFEKLVDWNTKDGNKKTFHHLKRQLEMMNRYDIAHKLSKLVNNEVVHDLKYFFFDRFHLNKIGNENSKKKSDDDKSKPINDEIEQIFDIKNNPIISNFNSIGIKIMIIIAITISSISILFVVSCVFIIRSRIKK